MILEVVVLKWCPKVALEKHIQHALYPDYQDQISLLLGARGKWALLSPYHSLHRTEQTSQQQLWLAADCSYSGDILPANLFWVWILHVANAFTLHLYGYLLDTRQVDMLAMSISTGTPGSQTHFTNPNLKIQDGCDTDQQWVFSPFIRFMCH